MNDSMILMARMRQDEMMREADKARLAARVLRAARTARCGGEMSLDDDLAAWAATVRLAGAEADAMFRRIVRTPAPVRATTPQLAPSWWRDYTAGFAARMVTSTRPARWAALPAMCRLGLHTVCRAGPVLRDCFTSSGPVLAGPSDGGGIKSRNFGFST